MKHPLKITTIRNLGYNILARAVILLLSITANIVLAQNLDSSDYGLIGFAMIFIAFLTQFSDFGISSAAVQKADLDDSDLYAGFAMRLALGFLALPASYLIATVAAGHFSHPDLKPVVLILSLNFLIGSLVFIPSCLLTRALDYRRMIVPQIGTAAVYAGVAIVLSLQGCRYWSIVIASVGSTLANAVLYNIVRPKRLLFRFAFDRAIGLFRFGSHIFLNGLIVFVIFNADNYLIGSVLGPTALGFYSIAFTWGAMAAVILSELVHNVLFPTFSRIQNDSRSIRSAYLRVLDYGSFLGILINLTLFVFAGDFLFLLLGKGTDKWMPALLSLKILCAYGILRAILEPVGHVLVAVGKPGLLTRATLISGSLQLILLYPALKLGGIEGVAALVTVTYAVQYLIYFPHLNRHYQILFSDIWASLRPSVLSGLLVTVFYSIFGSASPTFAVFLFKAVFFLLIYILIYGLLTGWRTVSEAKEVLRELRCSKRETANREGLER